MALTTRPSQAGEGRTAAGGRAHDGAAAAAHALRAAPNGISSALAPEKPTTSQAMIALAGLDHDPGADRHGVDRARDLDHQAAHADHAAVDLDAVEFGDLFGQRLHARNAP